MNIKHDDVTDQETKDFTQTWTRLNSMWCHVSLMSLCLCLVCRTPRRNEERDPTTNLTRSPVHR